MKPTEEAERIEQEAADWLAELGEGASRQRTREFEAWKARDPRHAAAAARLEQACSLLEDLPLVRSRLLPVVTFPAPEGAAAPVRPAARRGGWWAAGLAAAGLVLAVLGWTLATAPAGTSDYATSEGGYNRVVLADGSVVELNANTRLSVAFTPGERRVTLQAGEAFFTVATDRARPFVVRADHLSVRAVGTAFNVRHGGNAVEVLVTEGKVALAPAGQDPVTGAPAAEAPLLATVAANERVAVPRPTRPADPAPGNAPPVVERVPVDVLRASLSWQERKLVFARTPLREVVAQFNRRNRTQLVLGDAGLAERPVGGTFAADNAEGFARLLETSGVITVERRGEWELVLRSPR